MAFGILFRDKNLLAENIKKGVKILRVTGTCEGGGGTINNRDITADSSVALQTFTAGEGYDGIGVFTLRPYSKENRTVDSSTSVQVITPETSDCLWTVIVNPYILDSKTVDSSTVSQTVNSSADGLGSVTVNPYTLDSKTVDSSTVQQVVNSSADGLSSVTVNPYVLDSKTVDSSTVSQTVNSSADGLSSVTVNPYTLDSKTVDSSTVQQVVTSSEDGLSSVTVNPYTLDSKSLDPSTVSQTVNSSADGLSSVSVNAVTSSIDSNIQAGNIKDGVTILGVTGNLASGDWVAAARKGTLTDLRSKSLAPHITNRSNGYAYVFDHAVNGYRHFPSFTGTRTSVYIREYDHAFSNSRYWYHDVQESYWVKATDFPFTYINQSGLKSFFESSEFRYESGINTKIRFPNLTSIENSALDSAFKNAKYATHAVFPLLNLTGYSDYGMRSCFENFDTGGYYFTLDMPSLTNVTSHAMEGICRGVSMMYLPTFLPNITNIDTYGMAESFSLTSSSSIMTGQVNFDSLTSIGSYGLNATFRNRTGLTSCSFPELTTISGSNAMVNCFYNCTGLTSLSFPKLQSINSYAMQYCFKNCSGITSVSFPLLSSISDYAMQEAFYNTGITSVDMSALEYLNGSWCIFDCFKNSPYLASVDLSSLISINGNRPCCGVFYGCSSLTSFDLSDLTSIVGEAAAYSMFENCTSLTTISFPSLTTINGYNALGDMFRGCSGLTTINFPALSSMSGTACVYRTFANCSNIVTATVHPGSIIESNNNSNLLGYVTSLTNLTLSADATNNIVLQWQPNLTAASVLSVLTHLDLNTSGKSVTFYSSGLTVTDDAQGSIQTAYDAAVTAGWTINNLTITAP